MDNKRCPRQEVLNNGSIITVQSSDMCAFGIQNLIGFANVLGPQDSTGFWRSFQAICRTYALCTLE